MEYQESENTMEYQESENTMEYQESENTMEYQFNVKACTKISSALHKLSN